MCEILHFQESKPKWFNEYLPAIAHEQWTIDCNGNTKCPHPMMICQHPPPFLPWHRVALGRKIYPTTMIFPYSYECNGNTKCTRLKMICWHPPPFLLWRPVPLGWRIYLMTTIFPCSCKIFNIALAVPTFDQLHLAFTQSSLVWLQNLYWLLLNQNGSTWSQAGIVAWLWWNTESLCSSEGCSWIRC